MPDTHNLQNFLDNPTRDAAIHFGAYLQLNGLLEGGNRGYGTIEKEVLLEQFKEHYQPKFHSVLVLPQLLRTLHQYRVIAKSRNKENIRDTTQINICKHPNPEDVQEPQKCPKKQLFVDQTQVLRERIQRSADIDQLYCRLCNVSLPDEQAKELHLDTDKHKFRLQYRLNSSKIPSSVETNSGKVTFGLKDVDDNKDIILREGERRTFIVKVSIDDQYGTADIFKIIDLDEVDAKPTHFENNMSIEVSVSAMFNHLGAYKYPLVAKIMPNKLCLKKDLIFRVESEIVDCLEPISPYIHQKESVVIDMTGQSILPGEELPKGSTIFQIRIPLGDHKIPVNYNKLLIHKLRPFDDMNEHEDNVLKNILRLLCGSKTYQEAMHEVNKEKSPYILPLNPQTYTDRFSMLVDFEELQEQRQIRNYDRKNETLTRCGSLFLLKVPDLSEGRPSVCKGGRVHVQILPQKGDDDIFEGIIHQVQEQGLLLGLHREFSKRYQPGMKVNVCFTVSRFCNLNMHRALKLIDKHHALSIVFPEGASKQPTKKLKQPKAWNNKLIADNPQQQRAVKNILNRTSGSAPYLVFGPPGTGKTVTLVETIVQVWLGNEACPVKQLVSAPSNAACNNIAQRLISSLPKAKVLRLFSLSTEIEQIPKELVKYANLDGQKKYITLPSMDEILAHDIIVATIVSSGRLVTGGADGVFEYVYIDECGQASEPEAMIAIAGILTSHSHAKQRSRRSNMSQGQLVLAGDPQQLGPILSSQLAKDFGLGMSLLERLMKHNNLYMRQEGSGYNNNYLTKLIQNFRSHPDILHLANKLFYDSELEVKGNPDIINKAVGWKHLPNKNFPMVFHGVQGLDERESNSPSYFNRQEIDVVIRYIKKLFNSGLPNNFKVDGAHIGVITPYRKQVQKFRKAFGLLGWENIRVGSVEEFQGSEKMIIFISTVRSNIALVEEDYRFSLGFLKSPKRFNVSITRAQALLIVVGNPNILRYDPHWYELLNYCRKNKAAVGLPFPDDDPPEHVPQFVVH